MRSKEVEEAIADLKLQIENEKEELPYSEECLKNKETVLDYIKELEKRDKAVLVYFDKEGNPIEYINKQVIRDKIKELDETKQYWTEEVIDILKSIIGE